MSKIKKVDETNEWGESIYGDQMGVLKCFSNGKLDGKLLGYLHYTKPGDGILEPEDTINIANLEVKGVAPKEYWRQGIGEALVRTVLEKVVPKHSGVTKVTLTLHDGANNVEAKELYEKKLGFTFDDPKHKGGNYQMTKHLGK
ncbi:acetyltransferase (GNAT) family domain-containing protein [Ditylenchus destructor]|uniref:Acetyltransferase (GNAT) family domain-containing protein n=1 Tax=Ditylenchus destructor TaxID=166010 RepID=A0AAD4QZ01_9BILA|nr:acetyltransferase (GNAT) family domain-containing protein [Ditylenchus destructor]